jgi:hypothetical protein
MPSTSLKEKVLELAEGLPDDATWEDEARRQFAARPSCQ